VANSWSISAFWMMSGGASAMSVAADADVGALRERLHVRSRPRALGAPGRGASSIAAIRPMLRMSTTFGQSFSECAPSSQYLAQLADAREQAFSS
jgi:hypothetical protein